MHKEPIRIEISIDRASMRRALLVGGTLVLFAAAGVSLAVPVSFKDGDVLTAKQLNDDFGDLEQRMTAVEHRLTDNGKYSVGAKYCGATASNFTGDMGGFVGAATACRVTCGGSPTAHMCVADEVIRSLSTGMTLGSGWYTLGAYEPQGSGVDCLGWTTAGSNGLAPVYSPSGGLSESYCNNAQPILCCD